MKSLVIPRGLFHWVMWQIGVVIFSFSGKVREEASMADPFAEFSKVQEQKLDGNQPKSVNAYLEAERKKLEKASSFSELKDCFPADFQQIAEEQFYIRYVSIIRRSSSAIYGIFLLFIFRQTHYATIRAKEDEIEAITERLYTVRFDSSAAPEKVLMSTKVGSSCHEDVVLFI